MQTSTNKNKKASRHDAGADVSASVLLSPFSVGIVLWGLIALGPDLAYN
jgi:hypothetical protein